MLYTPLPNDESANSVPLTHQQSLSDQVDAANSLALDASQRSLSPTTYHEMTSSSPSARRSPGISYAAMAARSPSPRSPANNEHATIAVAPQPPPPSPQDDMESFPPLAPPASQTNQGAGWTLVTNKKKVAAWKGKGRETAARRRRASLSDDEPTVNLSPEIELGVEPRKRRRVADDTGSDADPMPTLRKQNPLPKRSSPPTSTTRRPPRQSSPTDFILHGKPVWTKGPPSSKPAKAPVTNDNIDIDFAMASDSDPIEPLLFPASGLSTSASPAPSYRQAGPSRIPRITAAKYTSRMAHVPTARTTSLFPLPPSSLPPGTPRTPAKASRPHRRSPSPSAPSRNRRRPKARDTSSSTDDASSSPLYQPRSPPEIEMADASQPVGPSHPTRNGMRHEQGRRSTAAAGAPPQRPATRRPDTPPLPFDVDTLDADIIIPAVDSWHEVQGDAADWKKEGMAPVQRKTWDELDLAGPSLAMMIPNHGTEEPGGHLRIELMTQVFHNHLHVPGVSILSGYSLTGFHGMNEAPYWYLGQGIPIHVIAALVNLGWLNLSNITLHFAFWRDHNPHLCAMFRQVFRFGAQSKEEYNELVRRELLDSDLYDILFDVLTRDIDNDGMWSGPSRLEAITEILDSVEVEIVTCKVGQTYEQVAVIYVKPPTADRRDWRAFANRIQKHLFGSDAGGHPEPFLEKLRCSYCHSLGHNAVHCHVRDTPGWHASPLRLPYQVAPLPNQMNAVATGGGRGRGNGRGNGRGGGRGNGRGRGGRGRGGGYANY
ncbi:uncharacterized protein C8Q71DRAFT_855093 [Rhodofomes roseus]|uniref:Uncharacterized protein n=1 Tax=Rhodofomes roseus TaxID=34475 RepID=A0ABQ8KPK1_9APHY|nr:uncharacterized protein C8Q71DRAFT_855093 [Rhodofomes roseus]KAH9839782.1 hypothetical protein C8Q71DRAFT_855093 [Rhodofomes roseus]